MSGFEIVEHTADWSIHVWGADLEQLFVQAAVGMSSLLVADLSILSAEVKQSITIEEAIDAENLLVAWLSELAYYAEAEQLVFCKFALTAVSPHSLKAVIYGSSPPFLEKHIKAVTYHNLHIIKTERGLETTIVFDV